MIIFTIIRIGRGLRDRIIVCAACGNCCGYRAYSKSSCTILIAICRYLYYYFVFTSYILLIDCP
jgi:hypothetical protein